jgi:hypothetical protein
VKDDLLIYGKELSGCFCEYRDLKMGGINKVFLIGNLGSDPETLILKNLSYHIRYGKNGKQ